MQVKYVCVGVLPQKPSCDHLSQQGSSPEHLKIVKKSKKFILWGALGSQDHQHRCISYVRILWSKHADRGNVSSEGHD